jgi:hypothetical protein
MNGPLDDVVSKAEQYKWQKQEEFTAKQYKLVCSSRVKQTCVLSSAIVKKNKNFQAISYNYGYFLRQ